MTLKKRLLDPEQAREEASDSRKRRVSEGGMGRFEALDTHVVLEILSRLNPADILLRVRRVCKQWRRLANSHYLRHLAHLRSFRDPRLAGCELWTVLQMQSGELLFYSSLHALLSTQGRQLDGNTFSLGPPTPGHHFRFMACCMGLVCGRLLKLDEAGSHDVTLLAAGNRDMTLPGGNCRPDIYDRLSPDVTLVVGNHWDLDFNDAGISHDMTLAVGNPLTGDWRILPRVALDKEPCQVALLVEESGDYVVRMRCKGLDPSIEYSSRSRDWQPRPWKAHSPGLYCRGWTLVTCLNTRESEMYFDEEATSVMVERASLSNTHIYITGGDMKLRCREVDKFGRFVAGNKMRVLSEGVRNFVVAFVPGFVTP